MSYDKVIALNPTSEKPASTATGYLMLIVVVLAILADAFAISRLPDGPRATEVAILVVATLVFILVVPGFY
ncbi:MAG TPA: SPFH domain-containing protein, partial [Sphingomicrobium sp.]|nr:SPFH domain-containing protein [Sphingomicrobium sp.]